jgi:hypothetical protein
MQSSVAELKMTSPEGTAETLRTAYPGWLSAVPSGLLLTFSAASLVREAR